MNIYKRYFYAMGLLAFLFSNCQKDKEMRPVENYIEIQLREAYFGLTFKPDRIRKKEIQPMNVLCTKIISHSPTDTLFLYLRPFREKKKDGIKSHFVARTTYVYGTPSPLEISLMEDETWEPVEMLVHDTVLVGGHEGSSLIIVPPLDTLDFRLGYEISMVKVAQKYSLESRSYTDMRNHLFVENFLEHLVNAEVKYVPVASDYKNSGYPIPNVVVKKVPIFKVHFQEVLKTTETGF